MLDIKFVRENLELVRQSLRNRNSDVDLGEYEALDVRRRNLLTEVEALKSERNAASKEVPQLKREGKDAGPLLERLGELAERIKFLDEEVKGVDAAVWDFLLRIPNVTHATTPVGRSEADNPV